MSDIEVAALSLYRSLVTFRALAEQNQETMDKMPSDMAAHICHALADACELFADYAERTR